MLIITFVLIAQLASVALAVLLRPGSIEVFLVRPVQLVIPPRWHLNLLDLLFFLPALAVARNIHKAAVGDLANPEHETGQQQTTVEDIQQFFYKSTTGQFFQNHPEDSGIRHSVPCCKPRKKPKREASTNLDPVRSAEMLCNV